MCTRLTVGYGSLAVENSVWWRLSIPVPRDCVCDKGNSPSEIVLNTSHCSRWAAAGWHKEDWKLKKPSGKCVQQLSPTCKMPVYQRYGQTGCEILLNCTRIIIVQFDSEPMRLSVTARQAKTALARSPWFTIHSFSFSNHEYYRDQSHTLALQSRVWDCCVTAGYLGLIFKAFWLFRSQKYARAAQITWICKFLIKLTAHCSLMFCLFVLDLNSQHISNLVKSESFWDYLIDFHTILTCRKNIEQAKIPQQQQLYASC